MIRLTVQTIFLSYKPKMFSIYCFPITFLTTIANLMMFSNLNEEEKSPNLTWLVIKAGEIISGASKSLNCAIIIPQDGQ